MSNGIGGTDIVSLNRTLIPPAVQPGKVGPTGMDVGKITIEGLGIGPTVEKMQNATTNAHLVIGTLGNKIDRNA